MQTRALLRSFGVLLIAAALSACGGGASGGGSSNGPLPAGTPVPSGGSPAPSATPAGTATAPAAGTKGMVYACVWSGSACTKGAPIAGASVAIGSSLAGGALGGISAQTATAADGSYVLGGYAANARYLQVSLAGNPVVLHAAVTAGNATFPDMLLATPTADEVSGFNQVNADRAAHGSGTGKNPVILDEYLLETARYRANDMATAGYFAHTPPAGAGLSGSAEYALLAKGLPYAGWGENIALGYASLQAADANGYMSEGPGGGHYENIIDTRNVWVGLAAVYNGKALPPYTPNYSAEEFGKM